MTDYIGTFIHVPNLPPGRRLYALKQCMDKTSPTGEEEIKAVIEEALAHDWEAAESVLAWSRSRNLPKARGEAASINDQINAVYGAIHSTLGNYVTGLPSENPIVAAAKDVLAQVFPEGLKAIVFLPFETQLSTNDVILARFKASPKGDLRDAAETSAITCFTDQLADLNETFRGELTKYPRKETGYDTVEAAEAHGNRFLKRLVAVIIGTYHQDTKEAEDRRNTLLDPIHEQCERMRKSRKGRRPAEDVDPNTGDEIADEKASA